MEKLEFIPKGFTSDTQVSTKKGVFPVKTLVGNEVRLFNGERWWKSPSFKYIGKSKVFEIETFHSVRIGVCPDNTCLVQKDYSDIEKGITHELKVSELEERFFLLHSKDLIHSHEPYSEWRRIKSIKESKEKKDIYAIKGEPNGYFAIHPGFIFHK